jgi:site-specific DNA recombinase
MSRRWKSPFPARQSGHRRREERRGPLPHSLRLAACRGRQTERPFEWDGEPDSQRNARGDSALSQLRVIVRSIFERYLALGSMLKLLEELNAKGVVSRRRPLSNGRTIGGVPFTQGPLSYLLKNRTYVGEIVHRDLSYPGEHQPIVEQAVFDAVQAKLADNRSHHHAKRAASNALLIGKLFDDAGNTMTPTHSRKLGLRYRYYISRALLEGRKVEVGTVARVSAEQMETAVLDAVREIPSENGNVPMPDADARATIDATVSRVVVEKENLAIELTESAAMFFGQSILRAPWTPKPGRPKRDIVLPVNCDASTQRPMHAERRSKHLRAIAQGRKWLQELIENKVPDAGTIATREGRSKRSVDMMISLAFVAPEIIEASVAGRLPRGIGITRLMDLPLSWAEQKKTLGLPASF